MTTNSQATAWSEFRAYPRSWRWRRNCRRSSGMVLSCWRANAIGPLNNSSNMVGLLCWKIRPFSASPLCGVSDRLPTANQGLPRSPPHNRDHHINHRGAHICVAEQLLDGSDVVSALEQMRGERVPQRILTLLMNLPPPSFTTVTIPSTANT